MKNKLKENICWMNGHWGTSYELSIPISDRGLNLGDGIFETILIYKNQPQLLTKHLNRWQKSASILHMASPPSKRWLKPLIDEAIERSRLHKGLGALRLNWSRGDNFLRGIQIQTGHSQTTDHRFWLEINQIEPSFSKVSTLISRHEKRNACSLLSQCKTFAYGQSIQAKHEAIQSGYDEALLLSTNGKLCCSSTANLLVKRKDQLLTPPLESGCLPGIMRQQGLDAGLIKEANISRDPYPEDEWFLINSLSCKSIKQVNDQSLQICSDAKELWLSLLHRKP